MIRHLVSYGIGFTLALGLASCATNSSDDSATRKATNLGKNGATIKIVRAPFPFAPDDVRASLDTGSNCPGTPFSVSLFLSESQSVGRTIKHQLEFDLGGTFSSSSFSAQLSRHPITGGSASYDVSTGQTTVDPGGPLLSALTWGTDARGLTVALSRYDGDGSCSTPSSTNGTSGPPSGDSCDVPQPELSSGKISVRALPKKNGDPLSLHLTINISGAGALEADVITPVTEMDASCAEAL